MAQKPAFMNFAVDHMTLLLSPRLYTVSYAIFRIIFGVGPDDILYEKRRPASPKQGEKSMTFASRIGEWQGSDKTGPLSTIIAVVQPSEPAGEPSHVREMLDGHQAAAHWQHIALRTPDLIAFHRHALERGIQFITPILKDEEENLIQIFSGEWFFPGSKASGMFFEFLQRDPSDSELAEIQRANKQSWFRDETFLGLYQEKENEYRSGKVRPFLPEELFLKIEKELAGKEVWQVTDADLKKIEGMMLEFGAKQSKT